MVLPQEVGVAVVHEDGDCLLFVICRHKHQAGMVVAGWSYNNNNLTLMY